MSSKASVHYGYLIWVAFVIQRNLVISSKPKIDQICLRSRINHDFELEIGEFYRNYEIAFCFYGTKFREVLIFPIDIISLFRPESSSVLT